MDFGEDIQILFDDINDDVPNDWAAQVEEEEQNRRNSGPSAQDHVQDFLQSEWMERDDKEILRGIFEETERLVEDCLLYTSPSPRDLSTSRMPSSA